MITWRPAFAITLAPQSLAVCLLLVLTTILVGCGKSYPTSDYGANEGWSSRMSPDGVAIFRQQCAQRKLPTSTIGSLPQSAKRSLATLVWIPQSIHAHGEETTTWLEEWLKQGGKTLVYVGRDYSPSSDYWLVASQKHSNAEASRESQVNSAMARTSLNAKVWEGPSLAAYPWGLYRRRLGPFEDVSRFEGPWASELKGQEHLIRARSWIEPWETIDDSELNDMIKTMDENSTNVSKNIVLGKGTAPAGKMPFPFRGFDGSNGVEFAKSEKEQREKEGNDSQQPQNDAGEVSGTQIVLKSDQSTPLVTIVEKPEWKDSKVILLSNSSLISNLSLVHSGNRKIAERVIDEFSPGRVGFLSLPTDPRVWTNSGDTEGFAKLFTTQLNVLAVHVVLLGLMTLIILWPVFGRPRRLPEFSTQSFSQHISALGLLLQRTSDSFYALATIADYFRNVKKDISSPWSQAEPVASSEPISPFQNVPPPSSTTAGDGR